MGIYWVAAVGKWTQPVVTVGRVRSVAAELAPENGKMKTTKGDRAKA
jgi:hypothetical protein